MSSANDREYLRPRFVMPDLGRYGLSYDDFQDGLGRLSKPERGQFWQNLLRLGFEAASDQGVRGVTLLRLMELMREAFPNQVVNEDLIARMDALSHAMVLGGGAPPAMQPQSPAPDTRQAPQAAPPTEPESNSAHRSEPIDPPQPASDTASSAADNPPAQATASPHPDALDQSGPARASPEQGEPRSPEQPTESDSSPSASAPSGSETHPSPFANLVVE
ncbi:MAG: solute carrier family 39 (zinc transporter), member 1/2/3 [Marinobacter sp. T13-3]|nr:MAG: solute carrier family 39 (zinc transporter), member 1/2/3 [Marinobacter sp. T13-3]